MRLKPARLEPTFRFRVDELVLEPGTAVCPRHEVQRACDVCNAPTPDTDDPVCAACRAAVEF